MEETTTLNPGCLSEWHDKEGACYNCCNKCNYNQHICHFCGTELTHNSKESSGKRHWLSDCRPDLVKHEPGELCTWPHRNPPDCYAYDHPAQTHINFYTDGPMT